MLDSCSISQKYLENNGKPTTGFDYLRISLALLVVLQHSVFVTNPQMADRLWSGPTRMLWAPVMPMFFALSGFLVHGSLARRPQIFSFLTLRALRLVPALAVETLLSMIIIGPTFTSLGLLDYFTRRDTYRYMWNIFGYVHFRLPGVFLTDPGISVHGVVNMSLWTIPYELECYLLLTVLFATGLIRKSLIVPVAIFLFVALNIMLFAGFEPDYSRLQLLPDVGRALVFSFLIGVIISAFQDRIQLHWIFALVSALLTAALSYRFETCYLATIPAAYLTVYIGMLNIKHVPILFSGDYSYGLYLFAFPLQQVYCVLFPDHLYWPLNAAFTVICGLLYAAFSWWCIENPVLKNKSRIVGFVEKRTGRLSALMTGHGFIARQRSNSASQTKAS